ncbi:hypothetical protein [Alteromonas sp. 5E99-2]|uniref:FFLEELY motif protein n=1 Tax=Alteromonas sp. 5E99-2 TaxID=2817683 RepID=UPI001F61BF70|nr:hypothetical protein [Alteromonas sp. 5E99-2]
MHSISEQIIADLRKTQAQRDLAKKMQTLDAVIALQHWQCQRLLTTHAELAKQDKYKEAMAFFVDELYGPKDFSQRDADIVKIVPKLAALLPEKATSALADAIALNTLSFDMDLDLIHHLKGPLNPTNYAQAYRAMGRFEDRQHQLNTISHLGSLLADVVKIPGVSMLIKVARQPARAAGVLTLHEFLERGFRAFKNIGDVNSFISPIIAKEREIMQTLHSDTFDVSNENPIPELS